MPLQWPEKVRQAEAKYYQFVAAAMARGERIDDAAYRAALPRVESPQAVELPPDQAAYRLALLAAADGECGKEWSGKWRDELVKSTKAGGSALGEFLRARQRLRKLQQDRHFVRCFAAGSRDQPKTNDGFPDIDRRILAL